MYPVQSFGLSCPQMVMRTCRACGEKSLAGYNLCQSCGMFSFLCLHLNSLHTKLPQCPCIYFILKSHHVLLLVIYDHVFLFHPSLKLCLTTLLQPSPLSLLSPLSSSPPSLALPPLPPLPLSFSFFLFFPLPLLSFYLCSPLPPPLPLNIMC